MKPAAYTKPMIFLAAVMSLLMSAISPANAQSGAADDQYGGEDDAGGNITVTGTLSEYGSTAFGYGTHGIVEDTTMIEYALQSSTVDLAGFDGERVTVSGTFVPGYESGQVENGPPLIEVSDVQPADDDGSEGTGITGTVLEADAESVLVEDKSGGQYVLDITPETGFVDGLSYIPEETPPRNPSASDLRPGLTVQVFTTGPVAQSFPAQGEAASIVFLSDWYEDDSGSVEKTLSGYVTNLGDGNVTVSEDPSLTIEDPQYCNVTIQFAIEDGTTISATSGGETVPADAGDLSTGQRVDVTYTEDPDAVYPAICPPQRVADSINILSADSGDNGGNGGNGDGSGGNESGGGNDSSGESSGGVASDAYEVLPDTGGPAFGVVAAGMIVVAGGFALIRNQLINR